MRRTRLFIAAALSSLALSAWAFGWYCPTLGREFDFPYAWSGEGDPPLSMESKYAIVAMDAGLEYLSHWMKWEWNYVPANYAALANRTLSDKLLPASFLQSMFGKFGNLINDDYHYTYRSGEMTNEVLAFVDNFEIGYDGTGGSGDFVGIDDFRRIYPSSLFPHIGGYTGYSPAHDVVTNAYYNILGTRPKVWDSWLDYADGYPVDLGELIFANDNSYSWSLAFGGTMPYYTILKDVFYGYARQYHHMSANIPQMLLHCKSRTPYLFIEAEDVYTSYTTYFCQLTTNADNTASLKLNYVYFDTETSNAYSRTRPITYGDKISGSAYASGSPAQIVLENVPMKWCVRGEFEMMYDLPGFGYTNYIFQNIGVAIAMPTNFGMRLPYEYTVRHYGITKDRIASGFPSAPHGEFMAYPKTLYNYDCDGYDYYGNTIAYSAKGILDAVDYIDFPSNNPYEVSNAFQLPQIDNDISGISWALHDYPRVQVKYDDSDPTYAIPVQPHPTASDLCLVTYNRRETVVNGETLTVVDIAGWMHTNSWTFVEDRTGHLDPPPPATYTFSPTYEEVDGDWFYDDPYYWELPFHFYIDMFSTIVPEKWVRWE